MIVFQNEGTLDVLSIESFGVSVKENDNAIGFFGTGLKYALAVLMRERCDISIITGGQIYVVGTVTETIRGEEFEFVTLDGKRLAFTTELGKQWPVWKAYRELYCNAKDEGGEVCEVAADNDDVVSSSETAILVSGEAIESAHRERADFILAEDPNRQLLSATDKIEIYKGASAAVFYQGIKVHEWEQCSSLFTYNILSKQTLTEDRTLMHSFMVKPDIRRAIAGSNNIKLIREVLSLDHLRQDAPKFYETGLDFSFDESYASPEFMRIAEQTIKDHPSECNPSLFGLLKTSRLRAMGKASPDEQDQRKLDRAIMFLKRAGITDIDAYPITISDKMERYHLGEAIIEDEQKEILLNKRIFSLGVRQVILTLLEEYVHHKHEVFDESRAMQNVLFEMVVNEMERRLDEVL